MNALHRPLYGTGDVARAIGTKRGTVESWLGRSVIELAGCDGTTEGSGDHRRICRKTVHKIGIVHALVTLGITPRRAAVAAARFSDDGQLGRSPGALFSRGRTLLVVTSDGQQVCNASALDYVIDTAATIVDCGSVVRKIDERLGVKIPGAHHFPNHPFPSDLEFKEQNFEIYSN
jgi:hypothetical protein